MIVTPACKINQLRTRATYLDARRGRHRACSTHPIKPASVDILRLGLALEVTGEVSHHRTVHDSCPLYNFSIENDEVPRSCSETQPAIHSSRLPAHQQRTCALSLQASFRLRAFHALRIFHLAKTCLNCLGDWAAEACFSDLMICGRGNPARLKVN